MREKWEFQFNRSDVLKAAEAKLTFHSDRLTYWRKKQEEVMGKIRAEGLSIQESVAGTGYVTNGGYGPQVVVDATMQRDLDETYGKIKEHKEKHTVYQSWCRVLSATIAGDRSVAPFTLTLDYADYLFFYGE